MPPYNAHLVVCVQGQPTDWPSVGKDRKVPTDFATSLHFPARLESVWTMLRSESYLLAKCADTSEHTFSVVDNEGTCTVTVERTLNTELPPIARNLVGDRVTLREVQVWTSSKTSHSGAFDISVPNAPISVRATANLEAVGAECVMSITGTITVTVPLFSNMAESFMRSQIDEVLAAEHAVGLAWLAENA